LRAARVITLLFLASSEFEVPFLWPTEDLLGLSRAEPGATPRRRS
jgi:hypothetical protein